MNNNTENNQSTFWINRFGEKILIEDMDNLYLYNTVKMIFNNHILPAQPFGEVIHWKFIQKEHTPEFLTDFFYIGLKELSERSVDETHLNFIAHVEKHLKFSLDF